MATEIMTVGPAPRSQPITTVQMARAELLSLDLHGALFSEIQDWPGTLDENAVRRHPGQAGQVRRAIQDLIHAEMVQFVPVWRTSGNLFLGDPGSPPGGQRVLNEAQMLYFADEAATYLLNRDGLAVNGLRKRHNGALNQDHRERRRHRNHTGQLDDVVTDLMLRRFTVRSGRRDRINLRGLPQLVPDAIITARFTRSTISVVHIDALLEGGVQLDVQRGLAHHLRAAAGGADRLIVLECRSDHSVGIAQEEAARLVEERGLSLPVLAVGSPFLSLNSTAEALANAFPDRFITVDFSGEYERSARSPGRIRDKLRLSMEYAMRGHQISLIFITETDKAERFVLEESEALMAENRVELMVVTSTYDKITRRLSAGDRDVWTHRGNPIALL